MENNFNFEGRNMEEARRKVAEKLYKNFQDITYERNRRRAIEEMFKDGNIAEDFVISVDFDGTLVIHKFPEIGDILPEAFEYLKKFQKIGCKIILNTMRGSKHLWYGNVRNSLAEAVKLCEDNGINFYGFNENEDQKSWTNSPKVYANVYVDDLALGCPIKYYKGERVADWTKIGPQIEELIFNHINQNKTEDLW